MSHREIFDEVIKAFENADIDGVMARYGDDSVLVDPRGEHRGAAAIRADAEALLAAFSVTTTTTNFLDIGDTYIAEFTTTMTNTGPMTMPDGSAIPATGSTADMVACEVGRVREGRIVESHTYFDLMSIMVQLGLLPA